MFTGTSETTFSPNANMTRAMLVTVLHRIEGRPAVNAANNFRDVKNGQWYTEDHTLGQCPQHCNRLRQRPV